MGPWDQHSFVFPNQSAIFQWFPRTPVSQIRAPKHKPLPEDLEDPEAVEISMGLSENIIKFIIKSNHFFPIEN